jgi:acyl-CoA synthetase (AMP-forming)/AMP-acid ligase II
MREGRRTRRTTSEPGKLRAAALPELRWIIRLGEERTPGMVNLGDVTTAATPEELAALEAIGAQLQFDAPTNIQFTSGTTGLPRAPRFSHHNILNNGRSSGFADSKYGEELCAWIVLHEGATLDAEGVRSYCAGQIAHYKIPRYIRFVEAFPMTVTGKVQKYLIREQMKRELGLDEGRTA